MLDVKCKKYSFEIVKTLQRQVNFSDVDLNFIQNITLFMTGHSDQTLFHGEYKIVLSDLKIIDTWKVS